MAGKAGSPRPRRTVLKALALLLAFALAAPATAGQEAATQTPDFSTVTTRAAAGRLVRKHRLVKIHYVPTALGGPNFKHNIGYVTPEAAAAHAQLTEMLARYVERDLVDQLEIEPDYKGASIVPSRIRVKASHSRGGKSFESVIDVWGCGVCAAFEPLPDPDRADSITV
jgi:hypothetical protein